MVAAKPATERKVTVAERRARLGRRHLLAPGCRAATVQDAARAQVGLHATDPATMYLSARARVDGMVREDLARALYSDRSLVKHLVMRGTLFLLRRDLLPVAHGACSVRVLAVERRRLIREVEQTHLHRDGAAWLARVSADVLDLLADGREATPAQLRESLEDLGGYFEYGAGKTWGGRVAVAPRVISVLSAAGRVVRASNDGDWLASRPRWTTMHSWLGEDLPVPPPEEAMAALVRAWLRSYGPGTVADIKWWTGGTVTAVRRALSQIEAVAVDLDGEVGYLLPEDVEVVERADAWVALLPGLDPTTMGWKQRGWYIGDHGAELFDANGNAGPTLWCDGRIVGGWTQDASGRVLVQLLEDVPATHERLITQESGRLTEWLEGRRVLPRFPSPLFSAGVV